MAKIIPEVYSSDGFQDSAAASKLSSELATAMKEKEAEFGLEVLDIDVRGVYPKEFELKLRIRAMDPPLRPKNSPGHGLSADYWADVLSPPFFEKKRYGSNKLLKTPATVSLEWCIPSPPDFHHFNMLPRMTAANDEAEKKK
ncbi:MAG: hypothetical protein SGCHY_002862 [Lobulomycetales sp.]